MAGKVALEERLVDGHVLEADDAPLTVDLEDPVHQEKRVTMWQQRENALDINGAHGGSGWGARSGS